MQNEEADVVDAVCRDSSSSSSLILHSAFSILHSLRNAPKDEDAAKGYPPNGPDLHRPDLRIGDGTAHGPPPVAGPAPAVVQPGGRPADAGVQLLRLAGEHGALVHG